jgi:hypothetical protein
MLAQVLTNVSVAHSWKLEQHSLHLLQSLAHARKSTDACHLNTLEPVKPRLEHVHDVLANKHTQDILFKHTQDTLFKHMQDTLFKHTQDTLFKHTQDTFLSWVPQLPVAFADYGIPVERA